MLCSSTPFRALVKAYLNHIRVINHTWQGGTTHRLGRSGTCHIKEALAPEPSSGRSYTWASRQASDSAWLPATMAASPPPSGREEGRTASVASLAIQILGSYLVVTVVHWTGPTASAPDPAARIAFSRFSSPFTPPSWSSASDSCAFALWYLGVNIHGWRFSDVARLA